MINLSHLMFNPTFATQYKVHRIYGKWECGRYVNIKNEVLNFYGPVQSAEPNDLQQFAEGDREKGIMKFFCAPPNNLYITNVDETEEGTTISDFVEFEGAKYKIIRVAPWGRYGFIRAFGYRVGVVNTDG